MPNDTINASAYRTAQSNSRRASPTDSSANSSSPTSRDRRRRACCSLGFPLACSLATI